MFNHKNVLRMFSKHVLVFGFSYANVKRIFHLTNIRGISGNFKERHDLQPPIYDVIALQLIISP